MLQMQAWRPIVTPAALGAINHRVPDPFERLFLQEYQKVVAIAYRGLADRTADGGGIDAPTQRVELRRGRHRARYQGWKRGNAAAPGGRGPAQGGKSCDT